MILLETARVCLDHNGHVAPTMLRTNGSFTHDYQLEWDPASDEEKRTHADLDVATEYGAYGMAFLLLLDLTEHTVIERSAKGTGFDYWLGDRGDLAFQKKARLEISGILANPKSLTGRVSRKERQTLRSDYTQLPAYVVVVEFSSPAARITRR
jgi:hypothetical protein